MALDFPNSPVTGDTFVSGTRSWTYDGSAWLLSASPPVTVVPLSVTGSMIADGAVTSAKIADGTIVNADVNAAAAIDKTKISGTAVTLADTATVTNTMLAGSIAGAKLASGAAVTNIGFTPAPAASPTFSGTSTFNGTVVLPATTTIGLVTQAEHQYLDGVTSPIQTQLDVKASTGKAIAMAIVFGG
jgi:hypothetical protein